MANPTFTNIFGVDQTATTSALTALGVTAPATDARLAAHQIIALLQSSLNTFVGAGLPLPLASYSILKEADNIDIDTQRQIFTFTFDMKIAATTVEDEPA